jgi:hypothetical protein
MSEERANERVSVANERMSERRNEIALTQRDGISGALFEITPHEWDNALIRGSATLSKLHMHDQGHMQPKGTYRAWICDT